MSKREKKCCPGLPGKVERPVPTAIMRGWGWRGGKDQRMGGVTIGARPSQTVVKKNSQEDEFHLFKALPRRR